VVLVRFREYGLKLKPKQCELFQKEVEFLGRVVGPRGMHIGPGGELHNPKAILANSNNPYLVINAVLEQSSVFIFTCQYAELASSLEYHTFREYGLKLKPNKCELFQKEVEFLGRVVGPRGMHIGPGYIKNIDRLGKPEPLSNSNP
jgi:hypothetical protein